MTSNEKNLSTIRSLLKELAGGRQDYDFQSPTMLSHVSDHIKDPDLVKKYARQVISVRIMMLLVFGRMNTQALLDTYVLGVDHNNPFPLLLSARSQLELLSVIADTAKIISDNSGEHPEGFAERVKKVDEALIKATYGTRSAKLKELFKAVPLSKLRKATEADQDILNSKNVLSRLEKLSRATQYSSCKEDYERLCEYVHPNYGMNMLHIITSPVNPSFLRFSMTSKEPFERALTVSSGVMAQAARGTLHALNTLQPPFGMGKVSRIL